MMPSYRAWLILSVCVLSFMLLGSVVDAKPTTANPISNPTASVVLSSSLKQTAENASRPSVTGLPTPGFSISANSTANSTGSSHGPYLHAQHRSGSGNQGGNNNMQMMAPLMYMMMNQQNQATNGRGDAGGGGGGGGANNGAMMAMMMSMMASQNNNGGGGSG